MAISSRTTISRSTVHCLIRFVGSFEVLVLSFFGAVIPRQNIRSDWSVVGLCRRDYFRQEVGDLFLVKVFPRATRSSSSMRFDFRSSESISKSSKQNVQCIVLLYCRLFVVEVPDQCHADTCSIVLGIVISYLIDASCLDNRTVFEDQIMVSNIQSLTGLIFTKTSLMTITDTLYLFHIISSVRLCVVNIYFGDLPFKSSFTCYFSSFWKTNSLDEESLFADVLFTVK